MLVTVLSCTTPSPDAAHAAFLTLLPRIQRHAHIFFRHIACPDTKADKVAEAVALAWQWYGRLVERGKDVSRFPMVFTFLVVRAVHSGRRACGMERAQDVMSEVAQWRHHFRLESLPATTRRPFEDITAIVAGQRELDAYEERLRDNAVTPPPEAAAFRLDFPHFLATLSQRDRDLAMFLTLGHSGKQAARTFGISPGRVTQIRQRLCRQWHALRGEKAPLEA